VNFLIFINGLFTAKQHMTSRSITVMSRKKQYDENDEDRFIFLICSLQQNPNSYTYVFVVNKANATTTANTGHQVTPEMNMVAATPKVYL